MSTKTLTGWLLVLGPILTFLIIGVLYAALIGDGDAGPDSVEELMKNKQLSLIVTSLGSVVFVGSFIGMALLAKSMNSGDTAGSAYATVAGVIFVGITAAGLIASGMNFAIMSIAETDTGTAAIVDIVADGIFSSIFFYWGIGNILLGTAVLIQKRLHLVVGWLLVIFGILPVLFTVIDVDISNNVGFIVWIGVSLTATAAGVFVLRGK